MKKTSVMTAGVAAAAVGVVLLRSMAGGPADAGMANPDGNIVVQPVGPAAAPAVTPRSEAAPPAAEGDPTGPTMTKPGAVPTVPPGTGSPDSVDAAALEARKLKAAITNNLRLIWAGRNAFLKIKGRLPESLTDLVGPEKMIRELKPVAGEDYTTVRLGDPVLSVLLPDGTPVALTVGAPAAKGPPTLAETAAWEQALKDYLATRAAAPAPPVPSTPTAGAIELVGVVDSPEGLTFLVKDGTGGPPRTTKQGERVGRYIIGDYQSGDATLTLRDGESALRIKLREPRVVAPLAAEVAIAYQLIREVQRREGWPIEVIRVQRPQRTDDGRWFVGAAQLLERNEHRLVLGDQIIATVSPEGKIISYTNRGRAR